jgi:hypothetical protein
MTKSSVNFQPMQSALHSVAHSSRDIPPSYLLKDGESLGAVCLLDDKGKVSETLLLKTSLSSRQAKAAKNFSPLWEGVLNLPRPDFSDKQFNADEYKKRCSQITMDWCEKYQELSKHKVLRVDVHLDEGHVDEDGNVLLNAHAHIVADRTNERGKVNIISPKEMRILQTETAKITGLDRGKPSHLKHINAHTYKALAKAHGLETQQAVSQIKEKLEKRNERQIKVSQKFAAELDVLGKKNAELMAALDGEPARLSAALKAQEVALNEKYRLDREALKATGTAKQADYQALKKEHAAALENLSSAESKAAKVPVLEATVTAQKDQIAKLKEQYRLDREALKASGEAKQKDYAALKVAHEKALSDLKELNVIHEKTLKALDGKASVMTLEKNISELDAVKKELAAVKDVKVPALESKVKGLELSLESSKKKVKEMDEYSKELSARLAAADEKIAAELIEKANAIEALVREGIKSEALLITANGHRAAAEKLTAQPTFLERFSEWVKGLVEKFGKPPTEKKDGGQYVGQVLDVMPGDGAWAQKTGKDGEWVVHKGMAPPLDQVAEVKFRDGVSLLKGQELAKGGKGPAD